MVAVTIGPAKSLDTLRVAMAIGADRGIHITTDVNVEPLEVAKLLQKIVEKEQPKLILVGKQAIDNDCNQVGQMLAALCEMPQASFASKLDLPSQEEAIVTREVDGGMQTVAVKLPAVVTADLRLAEPRYVTLPNMMKAKKKPVETIAADTLGVALDSKISYVSFAQPEKKKNGLILSSMSELVAKLKTEAKVL